MSGRTSRSHGNGLDEATDGIKERIKTGAKELMADGEDAIASLGDKARDQVCDRPLTSLMVASGLGLLVGFLVSRKR